MKQAIHYGREEDGFNSKQLRIASRRPVCLWAAAPGRKAMTIETSDDEKRHFSAKIPAFRLILLAGVGIIAWHWPLQIAIAILVIAVTLFLSGAFFLWIIGDAAEARRDK
jgi:hypothetical protein